MKKNREGSWIENMVRWSLGIGKMPMLIRFDRKTKTEISNMCLREMSGNNSRVELAGFIGTVERDLCKAWHDGRLSNRGLLRGLRVLEEYWNTEARL